MSESNRMVAVLLILLFLLGMASPAAIGCNSATQGRESVDSGFIMAATNLVVVNETFNYLKAFDDDDFIFHVYNYTFQVAGANVTVMFAGNGSTYDSKITFGDGTAVFYNIPQGSYSWRVTWAGSLKVGTLVSDGPDVTVTATVGNLDAENDNDDLNATVLDVEGDPAQGLNFSIHFLSNDSIYGQTLIPASGRVSFADVPIGTFRWKVTVMTGPYAGTVIAQNSFISDGTRLLVHQTIGPFTGDANYYDLEIFTYFETTLAPIIGAIVNVTFYNGTAIALKTTPANGTVLFADLPIAFVNWSISVNGTPVGDGGYYRDLTTSSTDIRNPLITSQGDINFLVGSSNITVTWEVYDEHPKELEAFVNGVSKKKTTWTNQSAQFFLNVTGYALGTYTIKLVATDLNLNTAEDIITLKVYENVTPVISGPEDASFYYTQTGKSLTWNVTDDHLNKYSVLRNDTVVASGSFSADLPFVTVTLDSLGIGVYFFTLRANDTSGNEATDNVTVTVKSDDVSPTITYTPQTIHYYRGDSPIVRNWTATDDFKAVYTIAVDGFTVVEMDWTSETISFDFSGLPEGEHWVTLTVYDMGNNTAVSSVLVVVSPSQIVIILGVVGGLAAIAVAIVWVTSYLKRR